MARCNIHHDFFDENCHECQAEYRHMMIEGNEDVKSNKVHHAYKEFTEERAKVLYQEIMLQYIKDGDKEEAAASKARSIIRKQCRIRNIEPWPWV